MVKLRKFRTPIILTLTMPPPQHASTSNAPAMATLTLTNIVMVSTLVPLSSRPLTITQSKLKPARIYKNAVDTVPAPSAGFSSPRPPTQGPRHITGMSFDDRGDQVITAAEDETFRLYNCKSGKYVSIPS